MGCFKLGTSLLLCVPPSELDDHMHKWADSSNPQRGSDMPTQAVPEWRWFSLTHSLRGRSAPDGNDGLGSGHEERMRGGPLLMQSIHATFRWKSSTSRCAAWWLKERLGLEPLWFN